MIKKLGRRLGLRIPIARQLSLPFNGGPEAAVMPDGIARRMLAENQALTESIYATTQVFLFDELPSQERESGESKGREICYSLYVLSTYRARVAVSAPLPGYASLIEKIWLTVSARSMREKQSSRTDGSVLKASIIRHIR
jgi:hypothetical protein